MSSLSDFEIIKKKRQPVLKVHYYDEKGPKINFWTSELISFLFILTAQFAHIYIMMFPSKMWAEGSLILISITILHLLGAAHVILQAFHIKQYMKYTGIKKVMDYLTIIEAGLILFLGGLEIYLLYWTKDINSQIEAAFVGFALFQLITTLPQIGVTFIYMSFGVDSEASRKPDFELF